MPKEEEEALEKEVLNRRGSRSSFRPFLHLDALGFVLVGLRLVVNGLRQSRGLARSADDLARDDCVRRVRSRSSSMLNFGSRTKFE